MSEPNQPYKLEDLNPTGSARESTTTNTQTDQQVKLDDPVQQPQQQAQLTTRANMEPSATVKFTLLPMKHVVTFALSIKMPIRDVKEQLSSELKINSSFIKLFSENDELILEDNSKNLQDLGAQPNGILRLKVASIDPEKYPLKVNDSKEKYLSAADIITVHVNTGYKNTGDGNQDFREIVVEIERSNIKKPFLGGFRNKLTGKEYHNASAQTMKRLRPDNGIPKFCRDTQTVVSHHTKIQTRMDMATQMTKPGVFVSRIEDRLLTPRPYQTAEQREAIIVRNVIIIQKYYRRWLAKRRFNALKAAYEERVRWEREREEKRLQDIENRRKNDIYRRLNPRTKDDFEILYSALEKWRLEELAKINASKTGAARKAALAMLVDQEAELIATIERYKIEASKENKEKQIQQLLDRMSKPKSWKYKDGSTTEMDSPYNIRAKELKDIYNSLNMNYLTQDERLDVLLTLKHTVKEHDCKLTQEIISLIDREADLLMRGIREENLTGLRKRIATLFLQYIKTPQFNPAAVKFLRAPQDLNEKMDAYYCKTCERYLPPSEFSISSSSSKVGKCRSCKGVENIALKRVDFTKFKFMLKRIKEDELTYGQESRMCFLMNEKDIQYMFESIWNSQSMMSANNDIYQLHFVRWKKDEEWTPWNTILLTLDEIDAHMKLSNLELSYGEPFIKKVKQKHMMARNYFSKLPVVTEYFKKMEYKGDISLPSLTGIKIN